MRVDLPRVAFFPDAFLEVDGVAVVARHFEAFAKNNNVALLIVHAGPCDAVIEDGSVTRVQLRRGFAKFPLDRGHAFDLLLSRHYAKVAVLVQRFRPDLIQITGPSDIGILGALLAHKLKVPLAAFWQTNLPEYAGMRMRQKLAFLPKKLRNAIANAAQHLSFLATTRYYKIPKLLFAPNPEIMDSLAKATGKPCLRMAHGVDTARFHPMFRDREGGQFTIGYVGRLTAEKNVRCLADLEKALHKNGHQHFRMLIVGQGAEETWLKKNLKSAEFTGVLGGTELSRAYANMDVFVFPSETETFGLVVLEALSSGVPAVVTASGGPKFTVQHGKTGYVAANFSEMLAAVEILLNRPDILASMKQSARDSVQHTTWDHAFQEIYKAYRLNLKSSLSSLTPVPTTQ